MRRLLAIIAGLACLPGCEAIAHQWASVRTPPQAQGDENSLEGTWRLVSAVYGRPKDAPRGAQVYGDDRVVITADHFESFGPDGTSTTGTYTLDQSQRPWAIDFVAKRKTPGLPERDEMLLGICKV